MSFGKKFVKFCNDNVVMISGISIIIGFHWAWSRIQNVPVLVDPSEKKELPIILGAKYLSKLIVDKYNEFSEPPKPRET